MLCNFCNSENNSIIFDYTRNEKNNILKCNDCGLVFKENISSRKDIEIFYKNDYRKITELPLQTPIEHYFDKVTQKDAYDGIQFINKNVDLKNKNILEIGSASGRLLQSLHEAGTNVEGIELNDEYRNFSKKLGFNVFNKPIEELNLKNKYDGIVSFHTIEHFVDPSSGFKSIYNALKPNGFFMGEVPNQNDWRIKIFNDNIIKRLHYDPHHYYYYTIQTLNNYLRLSNFTNIKFETVERYNSILQLRNILCEKSTDINKHIFSENIDARIPNETDYIESEFNRIFEKGINSELMGNCIRWIAR